MRTSCTGLKLLALLTLPLMTPDAWAGLTCNGVTPCAALNGAGAYAGKAYFFGATAYRRYDWQNDRLDDGGSLPIFVWHLPRAFHSGINAALNGAGPFGGHAYFFKGSEYVRYNWTSNRVDYGPASIAREWGLPAPFHADLDAALNGGGPYAGKAYFFKGGQYARYDWASGQYEFTGTLAAWNLPPSFLSGIDSAINGDGPYAGKAYFFKGNQYVRYDWATETVDLGPTDIATYWPALLGLTEAPQRRLVLYVTLDPYDHHWPNGSAGSHAPNFGRVREIVGQWRSNVMVDDFWSPEVFQSMLDDPHVLALFSGGSFTEWVVAYGDPAYPFWQAQLDAYSALIRETNVPILAACGGHQLVAYAFGGWASVGHMSYLGVAPVSISDEMLDGIFRAPDPRIGEVGEYGFNIERPDPILAGLSDPVYFAESHHDQALESALPPGAVSLLTPIGITPETYQEPSGGGHRQISDVGERARVQLLRYDVPPAGRILYTTQFHPDLARFEHSPGNNNVDNNGRLFLRNFLNLADGYWQSH